ncbi:MAG: NACHT domain-containing protein [Lachnospiraceae bacterium]|nr:NACHT domain-containing protein [Lachnospiraceae bacterium]
MGNDHQTRCLIKLVQNLRSNKENNRKKVTLLLGAGCSLSSSKKNITTAGIIRDLVSQYACKDEVIPEKWTNLYEQFVNTIWNGQGNIDRIHLLENYFKDMEPSLGYKQLRSLIEENYINNIITTNFDPMLDTVLEGLSYNLQVGTKKMVIGNEPNFTLLKAHGDLKLGQLRFAPSELYKLPKEIEDVIKLLTDSILIIVGYRGQDMGIIQALSDSANHCVYWITYDKPDYYNEYENGPILNLLKKRNSEYNLLDGPEYGDFDSIFNKIFLMLHDSSSRQENRFYELWKKSYINDYLTLNIRFQKLFIKMLNILEEYLKELSWNSCSLYYADSHDKLLTSIIEILNEKVFPAEMLYSISNEIDGLLLALSIEIWCLCQGYSVTNSDLISLLRKKCAKNQESPDINQDFWDALSWLSSIPISGMPTFPKPYCEIIITLDKGKDLQMILKQISLREFASVFMLLQRILLFIKTSGVGEDVIGLNYKKTLEQYLYQVLSHENNIDIQLDQMPPSVYQEIFDNLLSRYFSEQAIRNRRILNFENLYIQVNLVESYDNATFGIIDELMLKSEKMKSSFIGQFDGTKIICNKSYATILKFLNSENSGLFIAGDSGIGKTCLIKKIIIDSSIEKYIFFPISAKQIEETENVLGSVFGEEIFDSDKIKYLNTMLKMRHQMLVLIIDGINEMDAPLLHILSVYKVILQFCDLLSMEQLTNIRMIVTCRTEFYYQIQNSLHIIPSPSSFFSEVDKNGEASTVYNFPSLSDKDMEEIVNQYSYPMETDIHIIKKRFGKIIYNPLYLNMICKMISEDLPDEMVSSQISLYELWFKNIQNIALAQQIPVSSLNEIINYVIYDKYFDISEEVLTTSKLFMNLPEKVEYASEIFEWAVEQDIFQRTQPCQNLIIFSHDKIEEFFLIQYIQKSYAWNLKQAFSDLKLRQQNSPIVQNSIYTLLSTLQSTNLDMLKIYLISIISDDIEWLLILTARFLVEEKILYDVLKLVEEFICRSAMEKFVSVLLEQMAQKINNINIFPLNSIKQINDYIQHSIITNTPLFMASSYYNYAKYIWTFPIDETETSYDFAISLCHKINRLDLRCLPQRLIDNNDQLLAVLLRNKGQLNDAVNLMEKVYKNLYENACFNEACQALLDLGAMYRELTWFDQALQIYQEYPVEFVTDLSLKYRLYMNIGIIYKNKVQNDLFNKNVTREITYDNYYKSRDLFEKVYNYAQEINHIPLLLEIIAELIESTVAGFYLNMTTISTAVSYAKEMDAFLPKYPVPVRKIQSCRMWARVLTLQGKPLEALDKLREGFQIASRYHIPFRAADCCNQISGILCDNLNGDFITREILKEGIEACHYSINYYMQLKQCEHVYLADSRKKLEILHHALENML